MFCEHAALDFKGQGQRACRLSAVVDTPECGFADSMTTGTSLLRVGNSLALPRWVPGAFMMTEEIIRQDESRIHR